MPVVVRLAWAHERQNYKRQQESGRSVLFGGLGIRICPSGSLPNRLGIAPPYGRRFLVLRVATQSIELNSRSTK